ncbi:unnamed protein product [Cochlearia groenlandica]
MEKDLDSKIPPRRSSMIRRIFSFPCRNVSQMRMSKSSRMKSRGSSPRQDLMVKIQHISPNYVVTTKESSFVHERIQSHEDAPPRRAFNSGKQNMFHDPSPSIDFTFPPQGSATEPKDDTLDGDYDGYPW